MATSMDDLFRQQLDNAQTAFARRQQAGALPNNQLPSGPTAPPPAQAMPNQTWLLHPPGQPAPRQHFNFEPHGNGAWRIYPPGVQAPPHGPQGTLPVMPPSFDHLQSLGNDLDRHFGQGQSPPVPGPFPTPPPPPRPGPGPVSVAPGPRPPGGIAGLV
jgi:hypothetical protein